MKMDKKKPRFLNPYPYWPMNEGSKTSMRKTTSYPVVKKMNLGKKKLISKDYLKEKLRAEMINLKGKP